MEIALDANSTPTLKDLAIGVSAVGEREEFDSMGKVMVPADRYRGAQPQRSLQHFSIGDDRMPKGRLPRLWLREESVRSCQP
jgi:fumarate hydratase class II